MSAQQTPTDNAVIRVPDERTPHPASPSTPEQVFDALAAAWQAGYDAALAFTDGKTPTPTNPYKTDHAESEPMNLNDYRDQCGKAAAENGWHDAYHRAVEVRRLLGPEFDQALTDHIVAKTYLISTEVSEAIEEIRAGLAPTENYTGANSKPEGYPSELADVIIRALDLAYMLDIDIDAAVQEKLAYNATRGHLHGGKAL